MSLQSAWVLHHYPYRDTSALLKLFTDSGDLVTAIAKGVKRPKSHWRSLIQPFVPVLLDVVGKGEVKTVKTLEPNGPPYRFSAKTLASAYYLNELLLYFLHPHDPHPDIFDLYQRALSMLEQDIEIALRLFEFDLLESLGYGVPLDADESGNAIDPKAHYHITPESHPRRLAQPNESCYTGEALLAIAALDFTVAANKRAAKAMARQLLHFYCKGKRFKSRELLV